MRMLHVVAVGACLQLQNLKNCATSALGIGHMKMVLMVIELQVELTATASSYLLAFILPAVLCMAIMIIIGQVLKGVAILMLVACIFINLAHL